MAPVVLAFLVTAVGHAQCTASLNLRTARMVICSCGGCTLPAFVIVVERPEGTAPHEFL
jgi:hypothetical protein